MHFASIRLLPVLAVFTLMLGLAAPSPSSALSLDELRRDGELVARALALGERGNWVEAQSVVAGAHPVVRDIVLWRKLRAGAGSVAEYSGYLARRPGWPGARALDRRGRSSGIGTSNLSGTAAANYSNFRALQKRRDYVAAEQALIRASASRAGLGYPSVWADSRLSAARRAVREGRSQAAYDIASRHLLTPGDGYDYADSEWIAGWVALRMLNDPKRAITHFKRFRDAVETPISIGRGGYWLGRAYEAIGDKANAMRWYRDAAQYQTSFYGQLAAAKAKVPGDQQLAASSLPDWRNHPELQGDLVRLAATLHFAGEDGLAMSTFSKLGESAPLASLAPMTKLALDLGRPHYAVRLAKKAARRGVLIYPAYYPLHDLRSVARKVEPAFALSIARQETELNQNAVSRAGARGLMQLMPGTARKVAGWIGEPYSQPRLTADWRYNVRLGETYLARRTAQFGGSYALAAAAYNAGAGRVDQWTAAMGDPRQRDLEGFIDWLEKIPFNETRNYVQRVMEGLYVYRTRLSGTAGPMTIEQDLRRGLR